MHAPPDAPGRFTIILCQAGVGGTCMRRLDDAAPSLQNLPLESFVRIDELQFDLPPERIAQYPADRRDASRLLVIQRNTGQRRHESFNRLPELLPPGALLVLNDTRVLPARLHFRRRSGGRIEGLFLHEPEPGTWEIMLTESRRLRAGELLTIEPSRPPSGEPETIVQLKLMDRQEAGIWKAVLVQPGDTHAILMRFGQTPLPPYIKRSAPRVPTTAPSEPRAQASGPERAEDRKAGDSAKPVDTEQQRHGAPNEPGESEAREPGNPGARRTGNPQAEARPEVSHCKFELSDDAERYQTVYARRPGAVAAPTAGLHFTAEIFDALTAAGVSTAFVTLHVGVGTFAPIRCEDLADHSMHAEWYECPEATVAAVHAARAEGRPIVAVGTTSVRVLETCADEHGRLTPGSGWTRLFIYPPYRFKAVDAMLTNFHLPGSTLLAMIFAFAGRETILTAYEEAIRLEYRFYSYGDAMLIL